MAAGVTIFLAIVLFISLSGEPADGQVLALDPATWQRRPISSAAIGFGAVGFLASLIVPALIVGHSRKGIARGIWPPAPVPGPFANPAGLAATDSGKLALLHQTQLIVGAALNEGVVFFAVIAYMIEREFVVLGLAILLIIGLASRFPTLGRVTSWIESQQDLLLQDRQSAF
jgi:hypothetical protein